MTQAMDLLRAFRKRGITLWLEDGVIRYRAPRGRVTTDELKELRSHRDSLYELLAEAVPSEPIEAAAAKDRASTPLSLQQEWYWQFMCMDLTWNYFAPTALRLIGNFRTELVRKSIETVLRRHDALRSRIEASSEGRVTEVVEVSDQHFVVTDLRHIPDSERENTLSDLVKETLSQRIDISVGPLFVGKLFLLAQTQSILLIAVHHLVVDGISLSIFFEQFWAEYRGLVLGLRLPLQSVGRQYSDYVRWQRHELSVGARDASLYWEDRLKGVEPILWPNALGLPRAAVGGPKPMSFGFGSQLSDRLRQMANLAQVPLSMIVISALSVVTSRHCDQRDFILPLLSSGRQRVVDLDVVGLFAHLVPLRVRISESAGFLDLVRSLTKTFTADCERGDFGYRIVQEPALRRSAVAQWISCQDAHFDGLPASRVLEECGENLVVEKYPFVITGGDGGLIETEFSVTFKDGPDEIRVEGFYRADVFSPSLIDRFWAEVRAICEHIGRDSLAENSPISSYPWTCQKFCVRGGFQFFGLVNRSPYNTAN